MTMSISGAAAEPDADDTWPLAERASTGSPEQGTNSGDDDDEECKVGGVGAEAEVGGGAWPVG